MSEETEALMLAYVFGELSASAAREFERQMDADPELRAEVDGMKASHDLFGKDQAWGLSAKVDVPPPHLMDAILKAEAIARSPQVKEAMFKRDASLSSPEGSTSFTAKLSRWLLGGGLVVGAAAAVFLVVTKTSDAKMEAQISTASPAAKRAKMEEPPPPPSPTADGASLHQAGARDEAARPQAVPMTATPVEVAADAKEATPPQEPEPDAKPDAKPAEEAQAMRNVLDSLNDAPAVNGASTKSALGEYKSAGGDALVRAPGGGAGGGRAGGGAAAGGLALSGGKGGLEANRERGGADLNTDDAENERSDRKAAHRAKDEAKQQAQEQAKEHAKDLALEKSESLKEKASATKAFESEKKAETRAHAPKVEPKVGAKADAKADKSDDGDSLGRYGYDSYRSSQGGEKNKAADKSVAREPEKPAPTSAPRSAPVQAPTTTSMSAPVATTPAAAPPPPPPAKSKGKKTAPLAAKKPSSSADAQSFALGSSATTGSVASSTTGSVAANAAPVAAADEGSAGPLVAQGVVSPEELAQKRAGILDKRQKKEKANGNTGDPARQKRLEQANLALNTGSIELGKKNWQSALDAMTSAEHIDIDGALGMAPQVGEMRALIGLKRLSEAARIARRSANRDIKVPLVADAWLTGTQVAEQIGDTTLARDLWTRLLDVPAHRDEAKKALARLGGGAYAAPSPLRAKAAAPADFDAEAAAAEKPAAAAAPPPATDSSKE